VDRTATSYFVHILTRGVSSKITMYSCGHLHIYKLYCFYRIQLTKNFIKVSLHEGFSSSSLYFEYIYIYIYIYIYKQAREASELLRQIICLYVTSCCDVTI